MKTQIINKALLLFVFINVTTFAQVKDQNSDSGGMGNGKNTTSEYLEEPVSFEKPNKETNESNLENIAKKTFELANDTRTAIKNPAKALIKPSAIGSPEHNKQVESEINARKNYGNSKAHKDAQAKKQAVKKQKQRSGERANQERIREMNREVRSRSASQNERMSREFDRRNDA